ncbi:hypothetical protein CI109_101272 [Kwoniella shandongensis]|uniref:Uncharacterized protein n=1 Tax=Kwoniella shandongensis TaxID=1734106 RepID=A0A5M6BNG6_9TREE|nr:uncharacterized protein CI109_007226 [Kwoniella shandongensis]KAA5524434.1 hypothetical protein CI109_007226 [Kwoniella shandongensis]
MHDSVSQGGVSSSASSSKYAYATLITSTSYLPGAILLAHSLHYHSPHPLLLLYTPHSIPESTISALELEAKRTNVILTPVDPLLPKFDKPQNLIAERFADTWTKLRVFQLYELGYEKICFLDADMLIFRDPGKLFKIDLPAEGDGILANGACVCNLDKDPWAAEEWKKENCLFTSEVHPHCLDRPKEVNSSETEEQKITYRLLNSGMFVFRPSERIWLEMMEVFNTNPTLLKSYKFPDQDFLGDFYDGKWKNVGWQYNAIKTMRYWHPDMWRDDEVVVLHYIVDKPWSKRVGEDGVAGYLGKDGETHKWWWKAYEEWEEDRKREGDVEVVEVVAKYVAQ